MISQSSFFIDKYTLMNTIIISTHDNCEYGPVFAKKIKAQYIVLPSNRYCDNEFVHNADFFNNLIVFEQVIIVCSDGSITGDERIMRVLLIAHALKKGVIRQLHLVMPYLPYSRMLATSGSTVLQLFANAGIQKLFCMQMHEKFSPSGDEIKVYDIQMAIPIAHDIKKRLPLDKVVLCAPDKGAKVLTQQIAQLLEVPFVCADKIRNKDGAVVNITCDKPVGRKHIIIIDDILATGSTFIQMINTLQINRKYHYLYGYMIHGVLAEGIEEVVSSTMYRSLAVSHSLFMLDEHQPDIDYRYFDTADYFIDQIVAKLKT